MFSTANAENNATVQHLASTADKLAALARLPQTYDAARNAVAGQNAIARMSFDERANAMGLGSGARGQADLARSSVYRGTLAGIDREQANAASDIELTKANLQSQYETAIAQAKANSDATLANALYQELVRVQDLTRNDAQRAQNIALQYGLGKGDSLGGIASIRSIDDLADLIYGGSAARYTRSWTPSPVVDEEPVKEPEGDKTDANDGDEGFIDGKTLAEYSAAAGNYAGVSDLANQMLAGGSSKRDVLNMIKEAWSTGVLNTSDYTRLYNQYRG